MDRYHFTDNHGWLQSSDALFAPGRASYNYLSDGTPFCLHADVLIAPRGARSDINLPSYIHFRLTRPARVYALLVLGNPLPASRALTLSANAPAGWNVLGQVENAAGANDDTVSDADRWENDADRPVLRRYAVAVDVTASLSTTDHSISLPHPAALSVGGRTVSYIHVVFGPVSDTTLAAIDSPATFPVGPHPAPAVPGRYTNYITGLKDTPANDPPLPNAKCPTWLHDAYVVKEQGARRYWHTWHPMIDPVYWCYFDHEHGSYPGLCKPKFHYTAYHTADNSTADGRQDESHNGFKVFSFYADDGRIVIITLHAHLSIARRFHTRFHTFILAVFSAAWEKELELHMKMDFGALKGLFPPSKREDIFLPSEQPIVDELHAKGVSAFRVVYVINADDFPNNLDKRFWYSGNTLEAALVGRYEEWRGVLNCAHNPSVPRNQGFKFEFHEQQTAMKDPDGTGPDNQRMSLNGRAMRKSIVFVAANGGGHQVVNIGEELCQFEEGAIGSRNARGVFYTDSYFSKGGRPEHEWPVHHQAVYETGFPDDCYRRASSSDE